MPLEVRNMQRELQFSAYSQIENGDNDRNNQHARTL